MLKVIEIRIVGNDRAQVNAELASLAGRFGVVARSVTYEPVRDDDGVVAVVQAEMGPDPQRAACRYELGQHLDKAADMARGLTRFLQTDDLFADEFDAAAARALAGQVDDAAAAARALFEGQGSGGNGGI